MIMSKSSSVLKRSANKKGFVWNQDTVENDNELRQELLKYCQALETPKNGASWSAAIWQPEMGAAEVVVSRRNWLESMGFTCQKRTYLRIEEAVFRVDQSDLLLFIRDQGQSRQVAPSGSLHSGWRLLSYQECFELMIASGVPAESYIGLSQLWRAGHKVRIPGTHTGQISGLSKADMFEQAKWSDEQQPQKRNGAQLDTEPQSGTLSKRVKRESGAVAAVAAPAEAPVLVSATASTTLAAPVTAACATVVAAPAASAPVGALKSAARATAGAAAAAPVTAACEAAAAALAPVGALKSAATAAAAMAVTTPVSIGNAARGPSAESDIGLHKTTMISTHHECATMTVASNHDGLNKEDTVTTSANLPLSRALHHPYPLQPPSLQLLCHGAVASNATDYQLQRSPLQDTPLSLASVAECRGPEGRSNASTDLSVWSACPVPSWSQEEAEVALPSTSGRESRLWWPDEWDSHEEMSTYSGSYHGAPPVPLVDLRVIGRLKNFRCFPSIAPASLQREDHSRVTHCGNTSTSQKVLPILDLPVSYPDETGKIEVVLSLEEKVPFVPVQSLRTGSSEGTGIHPQTDELLMFVEGHDITLYRMESVVASDFLRLNSQGVIS